MVEGGIKMDSSERFKKKLEKLQKDLYNHIESAKNFSGKELDELTDNEIKQFILIGKLEKINNDWNELS